MNDTPTPRTNEWETYCDECYYHMWRVRRKNERGFDDGFHVQNGEGARQLVDLLNKQDEELTAARAEIEAVTEQRDDFRKEVEIVNERLRGKKHPDDNGLTVDGEIDIKQLKEQRDRLAEALKHSMKHMMHSLNCPAKITEGLHPCNCQMDWAYDNATEALQSLT
jgi:hypothetical protein